MDLDIFNVKSYAYSEIMIREKYINIIEEN